MLDLDRFKEINDSLGHKAGDEVLIRVGGTLRKTLPEQYVARFGGDEFAVFMPGATAAQARKAAMQVVDAIESSWYSARGIDVPVTASIGIAVAPSHGTNPDELLANADLAMYAAKAAGRNRYRVYSQTIYRRANLETRRQMQADLQEAIEARRWKLYTRPALCLTNTGPTLHRLQPRFTRPDGSVVPEAEHVRIGEHAGLLKNLDRWLIEEASRLLMKITGGGGRAVSIALPWQTLTDRAMVAAMIAAMHKNLPPEASVFVELTGLDTMQETRSLAKTMTGLRLHGYRFMLCVQGPPLLKLAQALPIDLVQLQRSIVADIHRDRVMRELVTSLIRTLHGTGIGTMADDVNSAESFEYLKEAGVDYIRGSVVGRARLASTLLRQLQPDANAA
jgi:diguanylate cyclase (GGDEF)-like protein